MPDEGLAQLRNRMEIILEHGDKFGCKLDSSSLLNSSVSLETQAFAANSMLDMCAADPQQLKKPKKWFSNLPTNIRLQLPKQLHQMSLLLQ
jgi:hypothetical protein